MGRLMGFVTALIDMLAQLGILLALAPLLTDGSDWIEARLAGRRSAPLGSRWRMLRDGFAGPGPVAPEAWFALVLAVAALAMLPLATVGGLAAPLADPLAVGFLLLGARAPVWLMASRPGEGLRRDRAAGRVAAEDWRSVMAIVPLLVLAGALVSIGLPGASGLAGLAREVRLQPAPGLGGALAFAALALLAVLSGGLLSDARFERLIPEESGRTRAVLRLGQDMAACGWLLLLADLAAPGLIAGEWGASVSRSLVCWIAAPLKLVAASGLAAVARTVLGLDGWGQAALLAGAAILLVLAGRLPA
jgi:hypothetical protein